MQKLVIDCGNTLIKAGVFRGNELIATHTTAYNVPESLRDFLGTGRYEKALIASVVNPDKNLEEIFSAAAEQVFTLTASTPLPFRVSYASPQTLGTDRLALVAGAVAAFPAGNCLIINFGSCVTYNLVEEEAGFVGGAISPGLQMRLKAMNRFTHKLPPVPLTEDVPVTGTSTEENLQSGALHGLLFEVKGFIEHYKRSYPRLQVVISGGDCHLISAKLKNSGIFADANLALKGLNLILNYNA